MRRAVLASFLLCLAIAPALADDDPTASFRKKEEAALATIADEIFKLSRLCSLYRAFPEARRELDRGLAVNPKAQKLRDELEKLSGKDGKPPSTFAAKYDEERRKVDEKCGSLLADLAVQADATALSEGFERIVKLLRAQFPSDTLLARTGAVFYEPYFAYVRKDDARALETGSELVDGKWLDKTGMAALDAEHSSWTNPWVLSDEVHELRTNVPLRTARQILAHIGAFRTFFLGEFQPSWDLRPPRGKLPVIVTATQAEHRARYEAEGGRGTIHGVALYMESPRALNPCLATFEPQFSSGKVMKIELEAALFTLRHEVTHQIAFEYSKHAADRRFQIARHYACVEGLARFMANHVPEHGRWRLARPRKIPMGEGTAAGDFAWCQERLSSLPTIEEAFALTRGKFSTDDYHVAGTLAGFLLEGEHGRYRSAFVRLLEAAHELRDGEKTLDACFAGIDRKAMQGQWVAFVESIKLDE